MRKFLAILTAALIAAIAVPAIASADSTVTLKMPKETQFQFPSVRTVKATNLPAKTYGYAPRWLVAESAVALIQHSMSKSGRIPATVHPQGARWDGGTWRVSYRRVTVTNEAGGDYSYGRFVVRKGSQRLTFNGYS